MERKTRLAVASSDSNAAFAAPHPQRIADGQLRAGASSVVRFAVGAGRCGWGALAEHASPLFRQLMSVPRPAGPSRHSTSSRRVLTLVNITLTPRRRTHGGSHSNPSYRAGLLQSQSLSLATRARGLCRLPDGSKMISHTRWCPCPSSSRPII